MENSKPLGRQSRQGIESETCNLAVFNTEPLQYWCGLSKMGTYLTWISKPLWSVICMKKCDSNFLIIIKLMHLIQFRRNVRLKENQPSVKLYKLYFMNLNCINISTKRNWRQERSKTSVICIFCTDFLSVKYNSTKHIYGSIWFNGVSINVLFY